MNIPDWLKREKTWREMVMYVAHPTRLRALGDKMEEFVYKEGFCPINPFGCGKFEHFEGGIMGRPRTLEFGLAIQQQLTGNTGVLGISNGVMGEIRDRLNWDKEKNIRVFRDAGFDPLWDEEYERLKIKPEYGDVFSELRGPHQLFVFVGTTAVGKTYWIEQLKQKLGKKIRRVKNVTTRQPRGGNDRDYYHFVSKEDFLRGKENYRFFESDTFRGEFYGSSLNEIRRILHSSSGIFALTPKGVKELYKCRLEVNLNIILFKPASGDILMKNLQRRGISDPQKIREALDAEKEFDLPKEISHKTVYLSGTDNDGCAVMDAVVPFLK